MFVRKWSDLWEDILAVLELGVFWRLLQTFAWVCEWGGRDGRQTPSFYTVCMAASANLPSCLSYTDALIFFFFEGFRFLKRWLSSQEHILHLQRTWVWFSALTPCRSPQPVTPAPEDLILSPDPMYRETHHTPIPRHVQIHILQNKNKS